MKTRGLSRALKKNFCFDKDAGLKMEAAYMQRTNCQAIMRQTVKDVHSLQHVENVGTFTGYEHVINSGHTAITLMDYCKKHDIKY